MATYVAQVPVKAKTFTVVVGTPKVEDTLSYPFPLSISAVPGGGGSIKIEFSYTPTAAGNPGAATWYTWSQGTAGVVTVATNDAFMAPVAAIRATATTANGTLELVG